MPQPLFSSEKILDTPIGRLRIRAHEGGISELVFLPENAGAEGAETGNTSPLVDACAEQLAAYFEGRLTVFDLPLAPQGTDFQRKVWQALMEIPFGQVVSYKSFTAGFASAESIRAVAAANGRNPIGIIVPCHRVIGADGKLVGYAGGLWRKEWLLGHEGVRPTLFDFA